MKLLDWKLFIEQVGKEPIKDLSRYTQGMVKSLIDKKFFIDHIYFDALLDFGCADGTLLGNLSEENPNLKLVGYDLSKEMLYNARKKVGNQVVLTDDWNTAIDNISNFDSPVLNLSSVIHEVYTYSKKKDVKYFWENQVFSGNFKYIVIRDMIPSVEIEKWEMERFKDDVNLVRKNANKILIDTFEQRWGSIGESYRTFLHFLLKYRYADDWDRENKENYVPITIETLKKKIPSGYKIIMEDSFILPNLQEKVKQDFGIQIKHTTHTKMIIDNLSYSK